MTISIGQIIVWVIVGGAAGYIAGHLWKRRGFGVIGNVVIGLLGALIGGLLFNLLQIRIGALESVNFSLADLVIAIVGSLLLLVILWIVRR